MKKVIAFGLIIAGCANSVKYHVGENLEPSSQRLFILDKRNDEEKKAKIMSLSVSNCWYGVYRIGDDQILPNRMDLLSEKIKSEFGSTVKDSEVIVHKFEVYNNIQKSLRKVAMASNFGIIGYALSESVKTGGCTDAFALDENPDNKPSTIVLLDTEYNKKRKQVKIVQVEPEGTGKEGFRDSVFQERMKIAINKAIDKSILNLKNN